MMSMEAMTMLQAQPKPESIERTEAIDLLRSELLKHTDGETSACKYASDRNVFCRGFVRFGDGEMRRKFNWITRRRPDMTREELDEIANRWQLARQEVNAMPLACDVQQMEHDMCRGWDDFSNDELSRFYTELTGKTIVVV
jgi:hypothetical protein